MSIYFTISSCAMFSVQWDHHKNMNIENRNIYILFYFFYNFPNKQVKNQNVNNNTTELSTTFSKKSNSRCFTFRQ